VKEISSTQNDQFKYWKTLLRSKGLRESKHFLLSGKKLVQEMLNDKVWNKKIECILIENVKSSIDAKIQSESPLQTITSGLENDSLKGLVILLQSVLFKELDVLGTNGPILVMQQPELLPWDVAEVPKGLELLCPFGDPQNLGAVIRTSYAFGVSSIVLLKEAAHPFLPKSIKASSGAVLKIPLKQGPSIHYFQRVTSRRSEPNQNHFQVPMFALDLKGADIESRAWPVKSMRLLLGEEGPGIPEDFIGDRIYLPMVNPMESLNAAVAAGIVIYHLLKNNGKNKGL